LCLDGIVDDGGRSSKHSTKNFVGESGDGRDLAPGMKKVWWYGYGERFARQMGGSWIFSSPAACERECAARCAPPE
jgi:hypothetical protein